MKVEVRYYSKTGNTEKLAKVIAEAVGVEAKDISVPVDEADILFLGTSVYAYGIASDAKDFIKTLDPQRVGKIVSFSSAALVESAYPMMQKLASNAGLVLAEDEFHCRGQFMSVHKGKPDEADLIAAANFAKNIVEA